MATLSYLLLSCCCLLFDGMMQHGRPAGPHSAVGRKSVRTFSMNVKFFGACSVCWVAVRNIIETGSRPIIQPTASAQNG